MKIIKKISYYFAAILCLGLVAFGANQLHPVDAYAAVTKDCSKETSQARVAKCGSCKIQAADETAYDNCMNGVGKGSNIYETIGNIVNWITMIVGILAAIMIIYGGVTMILSMGDPGRNKRARDTILFGIVGLIIVLLAFAIVNFVLGILQ